MLMKPITHLYYNMNETFPVGRDWFIRMVAIRIHFNRMTHATKWLHHIKDNNIIVNFVQQQYQISY